MHFILSDNFTRVYGACLFITVIAVLVSAGFALGPDGGRTDPSLTNGGDAPMMPSGAAHAMPAFGALELDGLLLPDNAFAESPQPVSASLVQVADMQDGEDGFAEIFGPRGVITFQIDRGTYAIVAGERDDGIQIINITDPANPVAAAYVRDSDTRKLDGPRDMAMFENGGRTYAIVASIGDNGVQVIDVTDPYSPVAAGYLGDISPQELYGNPAHPDDRYHEWQAGDPNARELGSPIDVAVFGDGDGTYAVVTASQDDAVQIVDITDPFNLVPAGYISDDDSLELDGAFGVDIFEVGDNTYAIAVGHDDHGIQIVNVTDPYAPTAAGSVDDSASTKLHTAADVSVFEAGSSTYAIVTGYEDRGIQIINVTDPSNPDPAGDIHSRGTTVQVDTFEAGGSAYAAIASYDSRTVHIVDLTDPLNPADMIYLRPSELRGGFGIDVFEVSGSLYAIVTGSLSNTVHVVRIEMTLDRPPTIALNPQALAPIPAGSTYEDAGATCTDRTDGDLTDQILTVSGVNTAIPGKYVITYSCTDSAGNEATATRNVTVVDDIPATAVVGAPEITIIGTNPAEVSVGSRYSDAGATCTDEIDGDLTGGMGMSSDVNVYAHGSYTVTYSCTDSDGNRAAAATRTVAVLDSTAPRITVAGTSTIMTPAGDAYDDAGATCTDGVEGDLTDGMTTADDVDTSTPGIYAVTYSCADSVGNVAAAVRTVTVVNSAYIITDGLRGFNELGGAHGIDVFEEDGGTYAIVIASGDDGIQIINITDPARPAATADIGDGSLPLESVLGVDTFKGAGGTFAAVTAFNGGIMIINVTDPAHPAVVTSIADDEDLALDGAQRVATFTEGDGTYAIVTAARDDGIQIIEVTDPANPVARGHLTDHGKLKLDGASRIAIFKDGESTYAAVTAYRDNGIQIINVTDPSNPTAESRIADKRKRVLDGASGIAVFKNGDRTYAIATAVYDDGIQIVDVTDPSRPTMKGRATYGTATSIEGMSGIAIFEDGGRTYAIVAQDMNSGIRIVDVTSPSSPATTKFIGDDRVRQLGGANSIAIFKDDVGNTYAAVTARADDGVEIIQVTGALPANTPPLMALNGTSPVQIQAGSTYEDAGATCTDEADGDLTDQIRTVSDINTAVPGEYAITYSCTDSDGNTETVVREVGVVDTEPPVFQSAVYTASDGHLVITFSESLNGTVGLDRLHVRDAGQSSGGATMTGAAGLSVSEATLTIALAASQSATVGTLTAPQLDIDLGAVFDMAGIGIADTPDLPIILINTPPTVDAGQDRTVSEGATAVISGTAADADGDPMTYSWSHDRAAGDIWLANLTAPSTTLVAPRVSSDTTVAFTLTVSDGSVTASDSVNITVVATPEPSRGPREIGTVIMSSAAPGTIHASWEAPSQVPANYRISWAQGDQSYKTWTDLSGNAFPAAASYIITGLEEGGTYKAKVRAVYDGTSGDWSAEAAAPVSRFSNNPPAVDAGPSMTVPEGSAVSLNGTATDADGDSLTYSWSHDSMLDIIFENSTSPLTVFTAPRVSSNTTVTITLTASDGHATGSDTVAVSITDTVADDQLDNTITPGNNTVVLEPDEPRGPRDIGRMTLSSTVPGVIDASWEAPDKTPANYRIMWAQTGKSYKTWTDLSGNAFPTATSHTITGLEAGGTYKAKMRAVYEGISGDWSGEAVLTVARTAAAANTPATGLPVITGTAEVGQTLRTDISGIADADGMTNSTFSYQWISGDGTDDADIAGATASSHVLTADHLNSTIKVTVTFTDDAGHQESLTSAATLAVVPAPNTPATGLPVITGTAEVGQTLRTDISGIADADGMTNSTFSYQWISGDGTDDAEIANATASTYVLTADHLNSTIKVTVTFTDDAGHQESLTSAATLAVAPIPVVPNTPATGLPVITGTAEVGQTLRTDISGIADADGMTNSTFSYQWISGDGTDDADIAGATASTYVLAADHLNSTIKVTVTFTDDAGHQESLTSAATLAVVPAPNTAATGLPVITGTAEVGQTLRTDISGIADADGMTNATLSYQWISVNGTDDADIAGATASTYVLTAGDLDSTIKITITFTDDAGHQESLTSAATQAVVPAPNMPATGLPVITGTAEVGQTLRTDISGIADADGMTNSTFSYQWISGDGTDDADIAGATASTYVLAADHLNSTIKVTVTFTDDAGHQESLTSATTQAVAPIPVVPNTAATGLPVITGTAEVGQTLRTDISGIADADGMTNATLSYQWISVNGTDDADIAGATASTYVLTAGDLDSTIKITITFTDDAGHQESLTSATTQAVAPIPVVPNTAATGLPVITGTAEVGQTLRTDISGIADADGMTNSTFSYQWISGDGTDDADIAGATASTYVLTAGDLDSTIKITITFTDDAGHEESVTSAATLAVTPITTTVVETSSKFITTWKTTLAGESITIPVGGATGIYTVDWGDGNADHDVSGDRRHAYDDAGTYTVRISGDFTRIYLNGEQPNAGKLQSIEQWGDVRWESMESAFQGASSMVYRADDAPDLSDVASMRYMFEDAVSFNADLSTWDVSSVTDMTRMFDHASRFSGDLSDWDVSGVTTMDYMFYDAFEFNGNISAWDVSGVTDMRAMFRNAFYFNSDLSAWDVSGVTDMRAMFRDAVKFNDNISAWNVSGATNMRNMFSGADAFDQNLGKWYIVLDDTVIEGGNLAGAIGRITAQNQFLDGQNPTYRIGSGADSEHFEIDGTALKLKKAAQNNLASGSYTVTITSTGEFGTDNSRTYEIVVADT